MIYAVLAWAVAASAAALYFAYRSKINAVAATVKTDAADAIDQVRKAL